MNPQLAYLSQRIVILDKGGHRGFASGFGNSVQCFDHHLLYRVFVQILHQAAVQLDQVHR